MVIAIIGILATLAVVALQQARSNARDSKRMADVKQIHTALELFFNENSRYPTEDEWNSGTITSSSSQEVFMYNIPSAPTPADGDCQPASNTYTYLTNAEGSTYTIDFCTGKQVSDLPQGVKQMTPGGIVAGNSGGAGEEEILNACNNETLITDSRDGNIYSIVAIGDQCWMATNLNIGTMIYSHVYSQNNGIIEKYCYQNISSNCDIYGGLYLWNEIMSYTTTEGVQGICPDGWYIPTDYDLYILENYLKDEGEDCSSTRTSGFYSCNPAAYNMRASSWGGSNTSGFSALPAGNVFYGSSGFSELNFSANFWSSSESPGNIAFIRRLMSMDGIERNSISKNMGLSVRCLKN